MKNKPSVFLKQITSSVLSSSVAKIKSMAAKGKMSEAKARLIISTLMKRTKTVLLGSISNRIHELLGDKEINQDQHEQDDQSKAIVPYSYDFTSNYGDDDDDKYPDLTHSLFDEELELKAVAHGGSIVEMVKNSKEEGEDFRLEDKIDHIADLFITRFYKQMRLQKLSSFKKHQEMMERSV
ncbi:hypothetical protein F3Y22_tig00000329pilonHSYRG00072 [Hibiscus syriacus]|uniref:Uncharacterized protein n=1 Tax=Hibiscus syriacus TaxID=106335 RepID=A0A6A3D221_HIBSY|nr:uncharacterized protein LOC120175060 [Hibiscus syriacus]KAE8735815.1 hypothetical protein F3Y22_tig00000329pilonHSYRG00072 [Hibiscus syriacus]